ncbi:Cysteine-rich protein 2-binding protein [Blyttiomyces sp. JEL0837]|nr:Cysteine-rich protein 2-binding protein [Blyttiomyces sp. JEL0837]
MCKATVEMFFRWKEDICAFIDRNWEYLTPGKQRTPTWYNTVASALSTHNKVFRSGSDIYNSQGWWTLREIEPPPEGAIARTPSAQHSPKVKDGPQKSSPARSDSSRSKSSRSKTATAVTAPPAGVQPFKLEEGELDAQTIQSIIDALDDEADEDYKARAGSSTASGKITAPIMATPTPVVNPAPKKSKGKAAAAAAASASAVTMTPTPVTPVIPALPLSGDVSADSGSTRKTTRKRRLPAWMNEDVDLPKTLTERRESMTKISPVEVTPDLNSVSRMKSVPGSIPDPMMGVAPTRAGHEQQQARPAVGKRLATESAVRHPKPPPAPTQKGGLVPLTAEESFALAHQLESSSQIHPVAARLRRRLLLQRIKRAYKCPIFDLDAFVARSLKDSGSSLTCQGLVPMGDFRDDGRRYKLSEDGKDAVILSEGENAVDKCIRERIEAVAKLRLEKVPDDSSFLRRLTGDPHLSNTLTTRGPFISPFTGKALPAYIWRDFDADPPAKVVLESILSRRRNENENESQSVGTMGSIDFVYFQPMHLKQVNEALARQFWEGIDVSENLSYPDFSIVALYKRLVVGCAFMTPEGYITYVMVRPGWEKSGIARFMLHHLIQSVPGKDVTLHVSANNNALILYQSFGFKAEQFIINFYDKYLPEDSRQLVMTSSGLQNLLDTLPFELLEQVWSHVDPLTLYINGRLHLAYECSPNSLISHESKLLGKDLWLEAFKIEGIERSPIFHLLPDDELPTASEGLCDLKSQSLYMHLCSLRPDLCSLDGFKVFYANNPHFGSVDHRYGPAKNTTYATLYVDDDEDEMEEGGYTCGGDPKEDEFAIDMYWWKTISDALEPNLLHVAMRNGWFDQLPGFLFSRPILLGFIAIAFGHVDLLRYLINNYNIDPERYQRGLATAAENGHLDVVRLLCEPPYGARANLTEAIDAATEVGRINVMDYLFNSCKAECSRAAMTVTNGRALEWLHQHWPNNFSPSVSIDHTVFDWRVQTAPHERIKIIRYCHEVIGSSCDEESLASDLAFLCDVECVEYILKRRTAPFTSPISQAASERGAIEFIKHMFGMLSFRYMVESAGLLGLRFFFDHVHDGGVSTIPTLHRVAPDKCGDLDFLKTFHSYLRKLNGPPLGANLMDQMAAHGYLECLKYMHYHGVQCTREAMNRAAANGHLRVVMFLHRCRSEGCTTRAIDGAAKNGHLNVVKWLFENRKEGCTKNAVQEAAKNGFLGVVRFLKMKGVEGSDES